MKSMYFSYTRRRRLLDVVDVDETRAGVMKSGSPAEYKKNMELLMEELLKEKIVKFTLSWRPLEEGV